MPPVRFLLPVVECRYDNRSDSFRLLSTGYFNPRKNHSKRKKRFVKNPLFPSASGQNKTLKLCQNNVVINTAWLHGPWTDTQRSSWQLSGSDRPVAGYGNGVWAPNSGPERQTADVCLMGSFWTFSLMSFPFFLLTNKTQYRKPDPSTRKDTIYFPLSICYNENRKLEIIHNLNEEEVNFQWKRFAISRGQKTDS